MTAIIDQVRGDIVGYDDKTQELIIRAHYTDYPALIRREYKTVDITLNDSRPLSSKQRRSCYAMLKEIGDWAGYDAEEIKDVMKLQYWTETLYQTADHLFSLADAPMSIVAGFQRFLVKFILKHDVPCSRSLLSYVDDIADYIYQCLVNKKCVICGKKCDLHHVDRIGMGRNRNDVIHTGLEVIPLCREHHTEAHTKSNEDFFKLYHLGDHGITVDETICKIYKLKGGKK